MTDVSIQFYDNLWIWKRMCDFYAEHPDHPSRWIHDNTKIEIEKLLENFL